MKVIDHLNATQEKTFSIEVLPPLKGENIRALFDHMDPLMEFKPPFIDVTYHLEEYVYKKRDNNLLERRSIRKRPGTVGICAAIQNHYKVDTVPHIICGGFSKEETENALIDLQFLDIENILALQGDPMKNQSKFIPEQNGHHYASELVEQIDNMNKGIYLDEELLNATPTNFCIGVAGYPEKHSCSPNMKTDLEYLKNKIAIGAEYVVTQMFFDNQKYIDFVASCRAIGIEVPLVPGIKPITSRAQINVLPTLFHIDIPENLSDAVSKCKNDAAIRQVGIEWTVAQSRELLQFGVPLIHFYSMGKSDPIYHIAKELF